MNPKRSKAGAEKPVSELRTIFSRNVRRIREASGLNQRELGKLVKGGQSKVWEVESQTPSPNVTLETVSAFAHALGVRAISLLEDSDSK